MTLIELSLLPELSSRPRFRIQGGWSEHDGGRARSTNRIPFVSGKSDYPQNHPRANFSRLPFGLSTVYTTLHCRQASIQLTVRVNFDTVEGASPDLPEQGVESVLGLVGHEVVEGGLALVGRGGCKYCCVRRSQSVSHLQVHEPPLQKSPAGHVDGHLTC